MITDKMEEGARERDTAMYSVDFNKFGRLKRNEKESKMMQPPYDGGKDGSPTHVSPWYST